jgi:hypothetical protein
MPIIMHCRMPCKEERITLMRREYMFLFKGEQRQLTRVENTLKNSCGFSNVVV